MKSVVSHGWKFAALTAYAAFLCLMILPGLSCEEALPPYTEPDILKVKISTVPPERVIILNGEESGTTGGFRGEFVNIHDEALNDSEAVHMEIEVWLKNNPSYRTVVQADRNDVVYASRFLAGAWITILPGDTATIVKKWSHRTSEGVPYWTLAGLGQLGATPGGVPYVDFPPLTFVARPSVQLFRKWPVWKGPTFECTFQYRVFSPLPPGPYEPPPTVRPLQQKSADQDR